VLGSSAGTICWMSIKGHLRSWVYLSRFTNEETGFLFFVLFNKYTAHIVSRHCSLYFTTIKRCLLLGRKVMTNLDSIFKSRDITLSTKLHLVKAMVFPVVIYGCESWTVKKAEHRRIDAFELWCWRRLLRVPWTTRRSNQSINTNTQKVSLTTHTLISQVSHSFVSNSGTPWIAAHQASVSITKFWSSPKLMCIESVMPSSHLIL